MISIKLVGFATRGFTRQRGKSLVGLWGVGGGSKGPGKRLLKGSEMKLQLSEFFNEFCFPLKVHELAVSSVPMRCISSCQMARHEPHGLAFCVFLSNKNGKI